MKFMENQTHKMLNKLLLPDRRTYTHGQICECMCRYKMEKMGVCVCAKIK